MLRIIFSFLLLLALSLSAPAAQARQCALLTIDDSFKNAAVVFTGVVTDIKHVRSPGQPPITRNNQGNVCGDREVTLRVSQIFKGDPSDTITLLTPDSCMMLGADFKDTGTWLVYARPLGSTFVTTVCDRTRPVSFASVDDIPAAEEITYLEKLSTKNISQNTNTWIEVKGGAWSPSSETLNAVQRDIKTYVTARPRGPETPFRDWKTYTFQYQGQKEEPEPQGGFFSWLGLFQDQEQKTPEKIFLYINAFCQDWDRKDRTENFVSVDDGGSCYFSLKYDPQTKTFYDLMINGEA